MILRICLFLFCFGWTILSYAQKAKKEEPSYYVFDENGNPCKIEEAKRLGILERMADTAWQWHYYHFDGPLISVETYRDKDMTMPHGYFAYFDTKGIIDSSGLTYNGNKDKTWYYFSDSLTVWQSKEYDKGVLIRTIDEATLKARRESRDGAVDTTAFEGVESEARFTGNGNAWINYLQKNLVFPDRAMKLNRQGTVVVNFVVDTRGDLIDIHIAKSIEYSLDAEARRLIQQSSKWTPAIQNNRAVRAYRRQPITFAFR